MKVMCIKDGQWRGKLTGDPAEGPKYGEVVTVVDEVTTSDKDVYILQEYPDARGYAKKRFIPLSDIDETELVSEREAVGV